MTSTRQLHKRLEAHLHHFDAAPRHRGKVEYALKCEADAVYKLLLEPGELEKLRGRTPSRPFSVSVREELESMRVSVRGLVANLFDAAGYLLYQCDIKEDDCVLRSWYCAWYEKKLTCDTEYELPSDGQIEKEYVKWLTAVWLGLYFLGVPFWHPWERVRHWEDEKGGGLPSGVCVAKAIGDIVRNARKRRSRGHDTEKLILLSGWPMVLFKDLVVGVEPPKKIDDADMLGRCYELRQLMLYAELGLPIHYFIPQHLVASKLGIRRLSKEQKNSAEEKARLQSAWNESLEWLRTGVFGGIEEPEHQAVYIVKAPQIPPCFINHEAGLYTFEQMTETGTATTELPLPASYMREVRRQLYVETFGNEVPSSEPFRNVLIKTSARPNELFDILWDSY